MASLGWKGLAACATSFNVNCNNLRISHIESMTFFLEFSETFHLVLREKRTSQLFIPLAVVGDLKRAKLYI
jgi:hypothetical protein